MKQSRKSYNHCGDVSLIWCRRLLNSTDTAHRNGVVYYVLFQSMKRLGFTIRLALRRTSNAWESPRRNVRRVSLSTESSFFPVVFLFLLGFRRNRRLRRADFTRSAERNEMARKGCVSCKHTTPLAGQNGTISNGGFFVSHRNLVVIPPTPCGVCRNKSIQADIPILRHDTLHQ